ncbi:GntR family transcriptional regulator [Salipiger marinus]|uniref:GntR family transcriptional regulator n=1 Tax=Salipiger marinus TaxID=555512 RepID=UPI001E465937|nr:GntR family transcriptional regulator [Salipiger manganoxidans]MCD1618873.1 GntR family transcriptional regulator [Salipiger manganoxidans]MEB3419784.1 GntR family transcriptional regulator [Salipiger manganoxidans]
MSQAEQIEDGALRPAVRAYLVIRDAILSGELASGTHLREETLASMTGTSRTPVRDALGRLVAEGLAVEENRSRYVADFSPSEIMVMFDLRARLEGYAARLAASRITAPELDELARLIEEIDALDMAGGRDATDEFLVLNDAFHNCILQATRSTQLRMMIRPVMSAPVALLKRHIMAQSIGIRASNDQHREIHRALASGNPDWAEAAVKAHVISTKPFRKAPADD